MFPSHTFVCHTYFITSWYTSHLHMKHLAVQDSLSYFQNGQQFPVNMVWWCKMLNERRFFEYSLYVTQQNPVAFSTLLRLPYVFIWVSKSRSYDLCMIQYKGLHICYEGKHYTVCVVSDAVWSKGHKDFPFTGSLLQEYLQIL